MYTTMCEINSGKLLYNTGSTAWHSVMTHRGETEGAGRAAGDGGIHTYTHTHTHTHIYIYIELSLFCTVVQ